MLDCIWTTHLTAVMRRLEAAGLTVKLRKCEFACQEIEYLGHKVGLGETVWHAVLVFNRLLLISRNAFLISRMNF